MILKDRDPALIDLAFEKLKVILKTKGSEEAKKSILNALKGYTFLIGDESLNNLYGFNKRELYEEILDYTKT